MSGSTKWIGVAVFGFVALVLFMKAAVVVGAGERGVVFRLSGGVRSKNLHEGLNFITPFLDSVQIYPVRTQTYTMSGVAWEGEVQGDDSISALTRDGQTVALDISLRFHLDPENVWRLHKDVGGDYLRKIVRPDLTSVTRTIVADYPVTDAYSAQRQAIEDRIQTRIAQDLKKTYIVVDEVLLRNVQFSEVFHAAIEQKQIAQQQAQRMQYVLQKARMEKEQRIIEADGDAKAIRLKGQALAENARLVQYEYLQKIAPNVQAISAAGGGRAAPATPAGR